MIHLFLVDSVGDPNVNDHIDIKGYLGHWPEVINVEEIEGDGKILSGINREPFTMAYLRLQNATTKYEGKVYIAVRANYSRFPEIEGYIERRVIPVIGEILDELVTTFHLDNGVRHDHYSELNNTQYALYVYDADTDAISDVVSSINRKATLKFVSTATE